MNPTQAFAKSCQIATHVIGQIKADQWELSTPCSEWNVRQLVGHMVYEISWVPDLIAGQTVAEVGSKYDGDLLGRSPKQAWKKAALKAQEALAVRDVLRRIVHLSYADTKGSHYCSEIASDIFIHSWDVAKAIGADDTLDPELMEFVYGFMAPREEELRASGLFGEHIDVGIKTELPERLLALYGRTP